MAINPLRNEAFLLDALIYFSMILVPLFMSTVLPASVGGIVFIAGLVLALIYMVFRDGEGGQSVGKRIFKIQVVYKKTGKPIGFGMALLRGLLTALPILGWIDFFITTFTPDAQRFTDRILGTELIVKRPKRYLQPASDPS